MSVRDFQRSRVYKAEAAALGSQLAAVKNRTVFVKGKNVTLPRGILPPGRGSWTGMYLPAPSTDVLWRKTRVETTWNKWALRTVADCQSYVDEVLVELGIEPGHYRVTDGRRARAAMARHDGTIRLPKWSRNRPVILHELAHHLRPKDTAAHGPEFCRTFLNLMERFLPERASDLEAAFEDGGCQVSPAGVTLQGSTDHDQEVSYRG